MAGFNKVVLMGNLTRDPELAYTASNTPVCKCGIAVNRRWTDQNGQKKDEVTFVDITIFGRSAETFNQYMSKGRPVLLEGRLHFSQWTDKEGKNHSKLDVIAERFTFLGSSAGNENGGGEPGQAAPPTKPGNRARTEPQPDEQASVPADDCGPPLTGDDIPF